MWKLLKGWIVLQVAWKMPFVLAMSSFAHSLMERRGAAGEPKSAPPKSPRVLVTYSGPGDAAETMDWKRIYKRATGRRTEVSVQQVGRNDYALTPREPFDRTIRVSVPDNERHTEADFTPRRAHRRTRQR